jgi:integrase
MARRVDRLNALKVSRETRPGLYPDGAGLYLQVTASGAKSWIYRYMLSGKPRSMGLGSLTAYSLSHARTLAGEARRLRAAGIDPIDARKARRAGAVLEAAKSKTFKDCATAYIDSHKAGWKNAKHSTQWTNTLITYVYPVFGGVPVQGVDTGLVTKVLQPIWSTKTETATRLRGRIEAILDWARTLGYRDGENPARWRGHLENILPKSTKVRKVRHHPALPYDALGDFVQKLRRQSSTAALALEFLILTAGRTGEVIGAQWGEIDEKSATWTVPKERMKGGQEHRVPLTAAALAVLEKAKRLHGKVKAVDAVFPGAKEGKALSNMAMLQVLRRMGREDLTSHGFRSTFKDWASERTNYPAEVSEMALAHAVGDKVEAAYRRGDLFEKRRRLMNEWSRFCAQVGGKGQVVAMGNRA